MTPSHLSERDHDGDLTVLWPAFLAGPFAWALHEGVAYVVIKPVCASAASYLLWLIAAVAFVIVAIGAWTGWRWRYGLRAMARDDGPMSPDRNYFLATLTIAFNALIGVLILASAIPQVFLSPCE